MKGAKNQRKGFWFSEGGCDLGFGQGKSPKEAWADYFGQEADLPPTVSFEKAVAYYFDGPEGGKAVYLPESGHAVIDTGAGSMFGIVEKLSGRLCAAVQGFDGRKYYFRLSDGEFVTTR